MNTVSTILKTKGNIIFTASSDTQVMEALRMMDEKGIGALIIFEDDEIKGLFTEGDYIRRVLLEGLDINNTLVDDVMTKDVLTIDPKKTINETMQLMIDKDIRYLPVLEDGKLLGVISVGDCIKKVIAEQEELIGHLEHYIQG
ncbi:MAG: CBS domain-containing protein [Cocleimonas sp.]|jgi:CBS domain-containing protein